MSFRPSTITTVLVRPCRRHQDCWEEREMWDQVKILRKDIDLEDATLLMSQEHLGCTQREAEVDHEAVFKQQHIYFDKSLLSGACMSTSHEDELANPVPSHLRVNSWRLRHPWSPRALTGVSARKLEKLALNSGTTGGARKMTKNASKKPFIAPNCKTCCANWDVHQIRR